MELAARTGSAAVGRVAYMPILIRTSGNAPCVATPKHRMMPVSATALLATYTRAVPRAWCWLAHSTALPRATRWPWEQTTFWFRPYGPFCLIVYLYLCGDVERPALHPAVAGFGRWAPFTHRRPRVHLSCVIF